MVFAIFYMSLHVKKVPSEMRVKRRLKSACASLQFYHCLRCLSEETFHPWLSKIQSRLRECAGLSESSLGAYFRLYFFELSGSHVVVDSHYLSYYQSCQAKTGDAKTFNLKTENFYCNMWIRESREECFPLKQCFGK